MDTDVAPGLIGCDPPTAPFVAKTYQMVCDPRTEGIVRWGRGNNSFLVADVHGFSQLLLPCFFKHGNFSSFVRQLNTYGFRKVHPDRWEFAHESFLRGRTNLLPCIVRRTKMRGASSVLGGESADMGVEVDEDPLLEEVQRLRQEQTAIRKHLAQMSLRLQATERRPDGLMSFLASFAQAEGPNTTSAHLLQPQQAAAQKKRQRMHFPAATSASPVALPPQPPALGDPAVDGAWLWKCAPEPKQPSLVTFNFEQPTKVGGSTVQQVPEFDGGLTAVETPFPFSLLTCQSFF